MKFSVTTYYYYRELQNNHLFKLEKPVIKEVDYYVFNIIIHFLYAREIRPNVHISDPLPLYDALVRVTDAFTTFAESFELVTKSCKEDDAHKHIAFAKRLKSLTSLKEALKVKQFPPCTCEKVVELQGYAETIKDLKGMKLLMNKFVVFLRVEYFTWERVLLPEYDVEELSKGFCAKFSKQKNIPTSK